MRITEFAAAMNSKVVNLADDFEISGITTLERAVPGQVSFVAADKYAAQARETKASAVIIPDKLKWEHSIPVVPLPEPWVGILYLLNHFHPPTAFRYYEGHDKSAVIDLAAKLEVNVTVGPNAVIGPRTEIGKGTVIGPGCVIGPDCRIGEGCLIHASCVVYHGCQIGNNVIIHAGAVIGADGFKYEIIAGKWTKIPQVGIVVIEDGAEIGANACIDRASYTETRIGRSTKIDNLVQIAHNVKIGSGCIIVSQSGVAGSTEIGAGSILAAQVGIADNLKVGNRVVILTRAGVKDDIKDDETVFGMPALPFRQAARIVAASQKLPDLLKEIDRLVKRVEELEKKTDI